MASKSKDYPHSNSGPESGYDPAHVPGQEPDYEDQRAGEAPDKGASDGAFLTEIEPPDPDQGFGDPPGASMDTDSGEDEQLLEMLEQLSETIDTAQSALAGQHELASATEHVAPPEPHEFLPPQPPAMPAKRSGILPLIAASAGVLLGVGALSAFWMLWKSPPAPGAVKLVKAPDRAPETLISRSAPPETGARRMDIDPAPRPEPDLPSQPITAPPAPAQASLAPALEQEPPSDEPAAMAESSTSNPKEPVEMAEPATPAPKEPMEVAAIPAETEPAAPLLSDEEEARFMARGKALAATGDVSSARLAYEYAARRKSMEAMFALAQTYDPERLAAWGVVGILPDISTALKWYERAAKLGHDQAGTRMRELELSTGR